MAEHWIGAGWTIFPWLLAIAATVIVARQRGASVSGTLIALFAVTWAFAVVAASFFPFPLPAYASDPLVGSPLRRLPNEWLNPYPFHTIANAIKGAGDASAFAVGNVLAYMPLGMLLVAIDPQVRFSRVVAVALLCSVGIELAQLGISVAIGFPFRAADIDDVLLNVIGALAGYAIVRRLIPAARTAARRARPARTAP